MSITLGSIQMPDAKTVNPWYEGWQGDLNKNKIDDKVETMLKEGKNTNIPIFVVYSEKMTDNDIKLLKSLGVDITYISRYNTHVISADSVDLSKITAIAKLPNVVRVEMQPELKFFLDISSRALKSRDSTNYSPNTAKDLGYTGKNIGIAIMDTGVDDKHEALNGKYVAGADFSKPGLIINTNPDDTNGHGTHTAGDAMSNGGSAKTYQGAAPDARLYDLKIGTAIGATSGSSVLAAMDWCIQKKNAYTPKLRIVSMSFGTSEDSDGKDTISQKANEMVNNGLIAVAATGNNGARQIFSPAAADLVIAVGATDDKGTITRNDDSLASYSNYGPRTSDGDSDNKDEFKPDVVAPGSTIKSTRYSYVGQVGSGYSDMTGTSMSTPQVAGVIALMLEAKNTLNPTQVKNILRDTSEHRGTPYNSNIDPYYNAQYGWGIPDAYKACQSAKNT